MGIDTTQPLPESFLRRMSAEDRKPLGKAGLTLPEINARLVAKAEKELQNQMENLLRQRDMCFMRSRMDKRSTIRRGWPDFTIIRMGGLVLLVEAKFGDGKPTDEQTKFAADCYRQSKVTVYTVYSLEQFRTLLDEGPVGQRTDAGPSAA